MVRVANSIVWSFLVIPGGVVGDYCLQLACERSDYDRHGLPGRRFERALLHEFAAAGGHLERGGIADRRQVLGVSISIGI
jgi:hypothetical protein